MHWLLGVLINVVLFWVHCVKALVIRWVPLKYRAKNISGEIALVTGAGGGIGRLISLGLAMQGCQVVCWDIAKQGLIIYLNQYFLYWQLEMDFLEIFFGIFWKFSWIFVYFFFF